MLANMTAPGAHAAVPATAPAAESLGSVQKKGIPGGVPASVPVRAPEKAAKNEAPAKSAKANDEDGSFASALKHARNIIAGMKPDGSSGSVQARFTVRTAVESTVVASKSKDIRNGQIAANEKSTRGVAALGRGSATDTRALAKMVKLSRHLEGPGGTLEKEIGAKGEAAKNVARDRKKKPAENAVLVLEFSLAARGSQTTQVTQETESGAEKQSRGTIEKKGGAARREPKLTVADMRSSVRGRSEAAKAEAAKAEAAANAPPPSKDLPSDPNSRHSSDKGETFRDILSGNGPNAAETNRFRTESPPAHAKGSDFQSLLAQQLHDGWNGEIVKSAHIVLKNGDSGLIRLRLKPESLGDVKIELNLSDKNISGKIVVQSDEAKHAFERNMNDLADAFRQGGFDSARLEVSVGSGSQQGNQGTANGDSGSPFYSGRLRSVIAPVASNFPNVWNTPRYGAVDILA